MVDKFPVHEDFKRLLSFVNQEMDRNIRDYKTVFPHLFTKVFERVVPVSSFGDVSGTTMKSEHLKSVKDVIQSKAQSPKPIQSSKSMGRGCGSMRDNARKGYAREHASFDPGYCSIQSLPGQFHDDNGDALSLSVKAAPLLRGVGIEVNGDALSLSDEAALLLRGVGMEVVESALLKPIDNFWAPGMQIRGKRKRILADDDEEEDGGTEDPLSSGVASQAILGVDNVSSAVDRIVEQAGGDIPSRVNYYRGRRQQSFKRLRKSKPPHRVFTEQSTQDFSMTENNVTDEETFNHQKDEENLEGQRDLVRKANQCAADAFLARLEERFYIDGAAQNSGMEVMGQSMDPANVEKIPAEIKRRQERNNAVHLRHRTAKKNKRSVNLSKLSDEQR